MQIRKVVDFCAAHSIAGAGKCENKHGHNWEATIEIDFKGDLDSRGFIVDVANIKKAAFKYDHDDLDKYFSSASTENVAQQIADDVIEICKYSESKGSYFVHVHLVETKNNSADAYASYIDTADLQDSLKVVQQQLFEKRADDDTERGTESAEV